MARRMRCPECGHEELQVLRDTTTTTTGKNYSGGQGCLGFLMFGPLGLLCGNCGQSQQTQTTSKTYWVCNKCGHKFRDPDDWRAEAQNTRTSGYIMIGLGVAIFLMILLFGGGGYAFMGLIMFAAAGYFLIKDAEREEEKIYRLETSLDDRSFFFRDRQFPVCARCTGAALGQLAGMLVFPRYRMPVWLCLLLCGIMFGDWLLQRLGILPSTNWRRLLTGIGCGGALIQMYFSFLLVVLDLIM